MVEGKRRQNLGGDVLSGLQMEREGHLTMKTKLELKSSRLEV